MNLIGLVGPRQPWPALTLAVALMSTWALLAATDDSPAAEQQVTEAPAKSSNSVPLIDFATYTSLFNKNYSDWRQTLVRQKLFTVKKIQVFLTAAKFRLNNLGYYMVINQYSDLTPEEERLKMSGDGGDLPSDDEDDDDDLLDDEEAERLLLAELQELDSGSEGSASSSAQHYDKRRPDPQKLAAAAALREKRKQRKRPKRSTDFEEPTSGHQDLSLADLVRVPRHDDYDQSSLKIQWVVPSTNPHYLPMEVISHGEVPDPDHEKLDDVPEDQIERIEESATSWMSFEVPKGVFNFISDSAKSTFSWLRSKSFNWSRWPPSPEEKRHMMSRPSKSGAGDEKSTKVRPASAGGAAKRDVVIKDWRDSGCIAPPIQQGSCQSCYAVSSTAFLEWAFCMNQDRVLTPLSVQYLVSCGPQFKEEADPKLKIEFYGCNRGRSRQAMYFVKDYGAELEANMPYMGRDTPCPVGPNTPLKSKGYIRPNVKQHVRMAANTKQLDLALKVGPVIVNFREPIDFMAYGGGMVGRCRQRGGHAMLVVGHGIENDVPYLIIKNSFGTNWGMHGYFKFDRKYTVDCVKDFVLPRVSFPSKKSQARHVKAYLAGRESKGTSGASSRQDSVLPNLDKIFGDDAGGLFSS